LLWKARQLRDNWRRRAKKVGKEAQVPSSEEILEFLKSQHPFTCYLTNKDLKDSKTEFDHVRGVSRGGDFGLRNVKPVSREANQMKADMLLSEYKSLMKLISHWSQDGRDRLLRRLRMSRVTFGARRR